MQVSVYAFVQYGFWLTQ